MLPQESQEVANPVAVSFSGPSHDEGLLPFVVAAGLILAFVMNKSTTGAPRKPRCAGARLVDPEFVAPPRTTGPVTLHRRSRRLSRGSYLPANVGFLAFLATAPLVSGLFDSWSPSLSLEPCPYGFELDVALLTLLLFTGMFVFAITPMPSTSRRRANCRSVGEGI